MRLTGQKLKLVHPKQRQSEKKRLINISDKRIRYERPRNLPYMAIISIQSINYDIEGIAKK